MEFGICTSLDNAAAVRSAGWDYLEVTVKDLLDNAGASPALPLLAANVLVPGSLKITGSDADLPRLKEHLSRVMKQAKRVGMKVIVFGSGGARNVPEGFDRGRSEEQILEFAHVAGDFAREADLTIAIEPLNRGECNILNTVGEAVAYAKKIDHPNVRVLVDSYHLWREDEPVENVAAAMPYVVHVHVADEAGRVAPGESGTSDYRPLFRILKRGGYDRMISVEATSFDIAGRGSAVLQYLKDQWKGS